jgi:hypothetical protein
MYSPLLNELFFRGGSRLSSRRRRVVAALHPTVPVDSWSPQRSSMAWYFDEALEAFAIVVWSLPFVLFLVAVALPCPLCRRDVRD